MASHHTRNEVTKRLCNLVTSLNAENVEDKDEKRFFKSIQTIFNNPIIPNINVTVNGQPLLHNFVSIDHNIHIPSDIFNAFISCEGIDINITNTQGKNALQVLAGTCTCKFRVTDLIEKTEIIIDHQDNNGNTALFDAMHNGFVDTAQSLIDKGIKVNIVNEKGENALFEAVREINDLTFKHVNDLLDAKINIYQVDNNQQNVLFEVVRHPSMYQEYIIDTLTRKGLSPDQQDINGQTVIYEAIRQRNISAIKQLLDLDCKLDIRDNNNQDPLQFARSIGDQVIISLIEQKLAEQKAPNSEQKVKPQIEKTPAQKTDEKKPEEQPIVSQVNEDRGKLRKDMYNNYQKPLYEIEERIKNPDPEIQQALDKRRADIQETFSQPGGYNIDQLVDMDRTSTKLREQLEQRRQQIREETAARVKELKAGIDLCKGLLQSDENRKGMAEVLIATNEICGHNEQKTFENVAKKHRDYPTLVSKHAGDVASNPEIRAFFNAKIK